jgi:DNA-binding GntR family transcriptional regulator
VADLSGVKQLEPEELTIRGRSTGILRQLILDGQLKPGSRINEVELAASLGISRGPLREAIQRLRSEGLITSVSHRGAFVREFARGEMEALFELRAILECAGAALAARRCTGQDIEGLRQLLARTGKSLSEDDSHYPETLDFHIALVETARNPALTTSARSVFQRVQLARIMSGREPPRAKVAFGEHKAILDAVAARDEKAAAELMNVHIEDAKQHCLPLFEGEQPA